MTLMPAEWAEVWRRYESMRKRLCDSEENIIEAWAQGEVERFVNAALRKKG